MQFQYRNLQQTWWLPQLLLMLLYLLFILGTIERHDFWCDEIYTLKAIGLEWGGLVSQRANAGHPPLFFLLEKCVQNFAGSSKFALRILPAIVGAGSTLVVYQLLCKNCNRRIGFLASLAFAFTPAQLFICQTARSYSLVQLLMLILVYVIATKEKTSRATLGVCMIACSGAMYTHNQAIIWIPVFLYSALLVWPTRWKCILAGSVGYASYAPFAIAFSQVDKLTTKIVSISQITFTQWIQLPGRFVFGVHVSDVPLVVVTIASILILLPFAVFLFRDRLTEQCKFLHFYAIALLAGSVLVGLSAAMGTNFISVERYFVPFFPVTALAASWWLQTVRSKTVIRRIAEAACAVGCLAGAKLYWAVAPFAEPTSIINFLDNHGGSNEPLVLYGRYSDRVPMMYYYPKYHSSIAEVDQLKLHGVGANVDRIWILICTPSSALLEKVHHACSEIDAQIVGSIHIRNQQLVQVRSQRNPSLFEL